MKSGIQFVPLQTHFRFPTISNTNITAVRTSEVERTPAQLKIGSLVLLYMVDNRSSESMYLFLQDFIYDLKQQNGGRTKCEFSFRLGGDIQ
jgi:hypothetical protein